LAYDFSSGGAIGSAESTKMGIHELAVFQGKIPEDSQAIRTRPNNNSLTSHEVCWIINIAMFFSSERYLIA
jgi:glycine cleavage system H lipoate-binding protein